MTEQEFNLEKLKSDLEVITEAATMYIQKHNPHMNMLNEPYASLVRGAINDFLYLEAHGFKIVRKDENSRLQEEKAKLIEALADARHEMRERDMDDYVLNEIGKILTSPQ